MSIWATLRRKKKDYFENKVEILRKNSKCGDYSCCSKKLPRLLYPLQNALFR